jgi:pimeloyl-ACP methyl ester carboxylesterase
MIDWIPAPLLRSADYLRRQVHVREPAGVLVDPIAFDAEPLQIENGWGTVSWKFYGDFLKELETVYGPNVHAVGYDWRQSLRRLGGYVGDKIRRIQEVEGAERFIIVTHSMGGLVARAAFAVDPNLKKSVAGVIYACQPAVGSITMYRRMFTGLVPGFDSSQPGQNDSLFNSVKATLGDRIFALILGGDRTDFLGKISGMPGAVSLLPNDSYPSPEDAPPWLEELKDDRTALKAYQDSASPPGLIPIGPNKLNAFVEADLTARLDEFQRTQDLLKQPGDPLTHHDNTWLIYGTDLPTETSVLRKDDRFVPVKTSAGDGTVSVVSATAIPVPPERRFAIAGLEHSQAFMNDHDPGKACIERTIELIKTIAREDMDNMAKKKTEEKLVDPLESFQVLGAMDEKSLERKLQELDTSPPPAGKKGTGPSQFGLKETVSDWVRENLTSDAAWKHTDNLYGFIPTHETPDGPVEIVPMQKAPKSPELKNSGLRVTLDRLYVADYPGSGIHHVLFNFSTVHLVEDGKQKEQVHFDATYVTRQGEHAQVQGSTIFLNLNVGQDGLNMKVRTVNVKNEDDTRLIAFLQTETFKQGLQLAKSFNPVIAQVSDTAVSIFKFLSDPSRKQNYAVQQFELGLDFGNIVTHGRLAEGSYVIIQYPGSKVPDWSWDSVAYDIESSRIYLKENKKTPFPYNYVILSISAMDKPAGA